MRTEDRAYRCLVQVCCMQRHLASLHISRRFRTLGHDGATGHASLATLPRQGSLTRAQHLGPAVSFSIVLSVVYWDDRSTPSFLHFHQPRDTVWKHLYHHLLSPRRHILRSTHPHSSHLSPHQTGHTVRASDHDRRAPWRRNSLFWS